MLYLINTKKYQPNETKNELLRITEEFDKKKAGFDLLDKVLDSIDSVCKKKCNTQLQMIIDIKEGKDLL